MMNAGKSTEVLKVANSYEEQGKTVMLFTSSLDDRYGRGKITSRMGLSREAILIDGNTNIVEMVGKENPDVVLIDEVQFLKIENILQIIEIVDELNIPVLCYGLKSDYRGLLFEGSEALLVFADKIKEIKSVCWYCNKKANMVLKFKDGKPVYSGEQIEIGGNDTYRSVCRKHYFSGGE